MEAPAEMVLHWGDHSQTDPGYGQFDHRGWIGSPPDETCGRKDENATEQRGWDPAPQRVNNAAQSLIHVEPDHRDLNWRVGDLGWEQAANQEGREDHRVGSELGRFEQTYRRQPCGERTQRRQSSVDDPGWEFVA